MISTKIGMSPRQLPANQLLANPNDPVTSKFKSRPPKLQQFIDITLKLLIYEFGKPRPNSFPKICPQAQIAKTLTSGDLENEVATPKS